MIRDKGINHSFVMHSELRQAANHSEIYQGGPGKQRALGALKSVFQNTWLNGEPRACRTPEGGQREAAIKDEPREAGL